MPESQVSWKGWVVIGIVTAGITPFVMELLPSIALAISKQWHSSTHCTAIVSQPQLPLKIHQAPTLKSMASIWTQQGSAAQVIVVGEQQGWYRVSEPTKGWVERDRISGACLKAF
ncbi:MAG: hypothetical protein KME11_09680 [Timaviella obliquedivisa GSE-PSE-MK23-08B]|jgi:hypothetical protein|nr:hypothetical protein [Timaviella obliquedivisa GSE-PSE-MK23-08B]